MSTLMVSFCSILSEDHILTDRRIISAGKKDNGLRDVLQH